MIYVIRNAHEYGPYDEAVVASYVEQGILLAHDKARDAETGRAATVIELLGERGFHPQVRHHGTLAQQLRAIGTEFIFPRGDMAHHRWLDDKRLLVLAIVGLSLSVLMMLPIGGLLVFYAVSLYFAVIWGLFFYAFFARGRSMSRPRPVCSSSRSWQCSSFSQASTSLISSISSQAWPSRSTLSDMCWAWDSPRNLSR